MGLNLLILDIDLLLKDLDLTVLDFFELFILLLITVNLGFVLVSNLLNL